MTPLALWRHEIRPAGRAALGPAARRTTGLWTTSLPTLAVPGAAPAIAGRTGEPRTRPGATNPA